MKRTTQFEQDTHPLVAFEDRFDAGFIDPPHSLNPPSIYGRPEPI